MTRKNLPDPTMERESDHPWHVAINRFHDQLRAEPQSEWRRWMYEGKTLSNEVPRMASQFGRERRGELPKLHKQCSLSPAETVTDNHLRCCLGVECRKCPELLALETADMPPEEIDKAKAWTCAAHIMSEGGDISNEGYLLTVDDIMFWRRTHESMAAVDPVDESEADIRKGESDG